MTPERDAAGLEPDIGSTQDMGLGGLEYRDANAVDETPNADMGNTLSAEPEAVGCACDASNSHNHPSLLWLVLLCLAPMRRRRLP